MPTKRRRRGTAWRGPEFSRDRREHLLIGTALLESGYGHDPVDLEAAQADWRAHRRELLAFWTQDPAAWSRDNRAGFYNPAPGGPGTRPAAWWWFDADDERLVLGLASIHEHAKRSMGIHYVRNVLVESEAAYLRRHRLLLSGESDRIPAEAFEPIDQYWPEKARELEASTPDEKGSR